MYQAQTFAAGVAVEFQEAADFFRLLSAPLTDVTVIFYAQGVEVGRAEKIGAGYAEKFGRPFDRVRISSAAGGALAFVMRFGSDVRYDTPPNGNVTVTNVGGAFVNAAATVTSASATLVAAKANRRYLLIQNNDASGDIFVRLDGTAATLTTGVKIPAGGSYELQGYVPVGAVTAIGSIASNANIVTVEG
jgi:hypothetical protein